MQIPPGGAKGSIREATFTASPATLVPLWTISPRWIPILIQILFSSERFALMCFSTDWISTAHLTASSELANSSRNPSPITSTSLPLYFVSTDRMSRLCSSSSSRATTSFRWVSVVNPTMSVNMMAASLLSPSNGSESLMIGSRVRCLPQNNRQNYTSIFSNENNIGEGNSLQIKTHLLLQRVRQGGALAPLDEEGCHFGDLAEGVMLAQCPFQVPGAARAAGAHAQADHAAHHHEMTVAPIGE